MTDYSNISIFIIAGGKSSRMGTDKGLTMFRNKQMILHAIDKLKAISTNITINANNPEYLSFGYPVIEDIIKDVGPIGGLHACLSGTKTKYNIIVPCDMPAMDISLIEFFILNKDKAPIIMPVHEDGKLEPVFALYHKSVVTLVEKFVHLKKYRLDRLIDESNHYLIHLNDFYKKEYSSYFINVNTFEDLNNESLS